MIIQEFNLKKVNRYLPFVLLIGVGIGTANYILNGEFNWIQWVIQSLSTSFFIGYTLILIAANKKWIKSYIKTSWKLFLILCLAYFSIGVMATEIEQIIKLTIFSNKNFMLFSVGKMYLFNGVIALVLGFSFFQNKHFFQDEHTTLNQMDNSLPTQEIESEQNLETLSILSKLPVKQDKTIYLIPIQDIVYLEAFDNYSFAFDTEGEKRLCDYSLQLLQERLGENFMRIHRKYIVNINHIKQIKTKPNARYHIIFGDTRLPDIVSSKSYAEVIRNLIRIT